MFHARSTWLDRIPFPPLHSTPSLLCPSDASTLCDTHLGEQFDRLAEQSPTSGYDPVEVSSAEVTTMLVPSRRTSEDTATTAASSEVDE